MNADRLRTCVLGDPSVAGSGVTATGASDPIDCGGYRFITIYYESMGTTSGGTVILEEACYSAAPLHDGPFTGTWSQIESRAASSFTGGVQLANHLTPSAYAYLRVRVSGAITGGGSIRVWFVGSD